MSGRPKIELVKNSGDERSGVSSGVNVTMPKGMVTGALLDGKYSLGRVIGSGAFGLVFEGKNIELDEKVAIKALRPEIAVDTAMVARFAREAKSSAALKSEYVCSVYDVGTSRDGVPYIVMEYLEGRDLGTILNDDGPFGPRTAVEYALQMCEALAVAHAKGIVHRDIKPENLMITERAGGMRILKVLDFGISKAALAGSVFGDQLPIVKTTNLIGTPLYMSPEQVRSSGGVDVRSDIWSVGMVLYEILAGATAFEGASITEICASILEMKPKPIELYRKDLPAGLVDTVKKCLEKDVKDRYQNVAELALALMPFGPKRSRLNVERAITILQSVGQVNKNVQLDSAPPPSSEISHRIEIPPASKIPFGGITSDGVSTLDEARRSDASSNENPFRTNTKKWVLLTLTAILVIAAGAGAGLALLRSGVLKSKTTTQQQPVAATPATETAPTATAPPAPPPTPSTPESAIAVAVTAVPVTPTTTPPPPTARGAAFHPPNKAARPAPTTSGHAATTPATTTPAAPPTPPASSAAAPTKTAAPSTGRTFRREL